MMQAVSVLGLLCYGKNSKSHHLYARHGGVNISCARVKRSGRECVMEIKNLWQFLKKYGKQVQLRDFSGKTAAIDASCWLYKALYLSMSQNGNRERSDFTDDS